MSLLVAGIVGQARMDLRLAQLHLAGARAAAAGDGAINLMLAGVLDGRAQGSRGGSDVGYFQLGEDAVRVRLVPAGGLIDLNSAPRDLLRYLFEAAGFGGAEAAEQLADNVIQFRRSTKGSDGGRITALEDVLRIPGFDRMRMGALRDLVVATRDGGGFDPALAPPPVLEVYRRKNPARVSGILRQRERAATPGALPHAGGSVYRVDAVVNVGGKQWLRRRWVQMNRGAFSNLPWQFMRTEAPRAAASA
jgi:hypothetical protein